MKLMKHGHTVVTKAASTDETRYILQGVYLEETEHGLRSVATDGRMLAMVEDQKGRAMGPEEFPANTVPTDCVNSAKSALIPSSIIDDAAKSLPKKSTLPVLQTIAVVMGKTETALVTTDLETPIVRKARCIEGAFPNYESVIPKGKANFTVAFNTALLGKALKIAEKFGLTSVHMEFTSPLAPMKIVGERDGQVLTLVVMPHRL